MNSLYETDVKIAFLERSLHRGGAERQLAALSAGLSARGHDVTVVLVHEEGPFLVDLKKSGVSIRIVGKSGRWDTIGFLGRLRSTISRLEPDIFCTFLPVSNVLAAFCKFFHPKLRTVTGVRASHLDISQYRVLTRLLYHAEPHLVRSVDLIVANSKAGCSHAISRGFPASRLRTIPNGIDTERFRPDPLKRRALRDAWGIGEDTTLIGLIARLDPMKDHETFLRAAASLCERRSDVAFICVGDEERVSRADLQRLAESVGIHRRLAWLPGSEDITAVFNACDLTCSTSAFGEGFSNALAEAMACGRRCVATDVGDAREIVADTGIIVPSQDPGALALALAQLCDEVRLNGTHSEAARRRIVGEFSLARMVERFEAEFLNLIASGEPPPENTRGNEPASYGDDPLVRGPATR